MTFKPTHEATQIAERALSMKISVDALLAGINESREEFRAGIKNILENPNLFLLNFIRPTDLDEDVQQEIPGQSSNQKLMERLYANLIRQIEVVREKIDGLTLSELRSEHFQDVSDRWRYIIFATILDVATGQSLLLANLDQERNTYLLTDAKTIIYKKLAFPRPQ